MSRRIEDDELENISFAILAAKFEALKSTCYKDHRGSVVFKGNRIYGRGFNGPIQPYLCEPDKCINLCGLYAIHAERAALIDAMNERYDLNGATVLHIKIDTDGKIQTSGDLRCDDCTGYMYRFVRKGINLKEYIIFQKDGWTAYGIPEADRITRNNLGLK